ncbi:MAG: methyltransferase family protein [Thioalkalivibrionaceae bacterium]
MLEHWLGNGSIWGGPAAWWFWPVYVTAFFFSNTRMVGRARRTAGEGVVRGETAAGLGALLLLGHVFAFAFSWLDVTSMDEVIRPWALVIGLVAMLLAMMLRLHCYRELGRHFTPDVRLYDDHRVIDTGAYRFVRHPGYSASLLMLLGLGMAAGTWAGLVAVMVLGLYVFRRRIRFEEQVLLDGLGDAYARFCETRKRLIPWIY